MLPKNFKPTNISLFGIIAVVFATIVIQEGGSEALEQSEFYSLNMSSSYNGKSTNFEWNVLKSMAYLKTAVDVIFEAFKSRINELMVSS